MADEKFEIIGAPSNSKIESIKEEKKEHRNKKGGGIPKLHFKNKETGEEIESDDPQEIMEKLGIGQKEFESILEEVFKNVQNSVPPELKKKMDKDPNSLTDNEMELLMNNIQKIFGPAVDASRENNLLDMLNKKINISNKDNEEKEIENEDDLKQNYCNNFDILMEPTSFGVISLTKNSGIYDDFRRMYGELIAYPMSMFVSNVNGYNLVGAMRDVEKISYINHTDKFIMFKAFPNKNDKEPFIVAFIQQDDKSFELIVPQYGNSYDMATGQSFDKFNDTHLFNPDGTLKSPIDMRKIEVGLDLLTYEDKKPILSVKDFGNVVPSQTAVEYPDDKIKIGKIMSNESKMAKLFKRDFEIEENKTAFDFYVKFKTDMPAEVLQKISDYLVNVDFDTNPKIQTLELKVTTNGSIYIDIDLGDLPKFISKWSRE